MDQNPDYLGDQIWSLAWVLLDIERYPNARNTHERHVRHCIVTSNIVMNFIGEEMKVTPRKTTKSKRYATGLEWLLGRQVEKHGVDYALNTATTAMNKFIDFVELYDKALALGNNLQKLQVAEMRELLILEGDCF